jgi:hypothetical protein
MGSLADARRAKAIPRRLSRTSAMPARSRSSRALRKASTAKCMKNSRSFRRADDVRRFP